MSTSLVVQIPEISKLLTPSDFLKLTQLTADGTFFQNVNFTLDASRQNEADAHADKIDRLDHDIDADRQQQQSNHHVSPLHRNFTFPAVVNKLNLLNFDIKKPLHTSKTDLRLKRRE